MILAKHFDTRLGQNIETYDKEAKKQEKLNSSAPKTEKITSLKEELNNTLLEYFFPDTEFSFGHGDEFTTIDELKNHPEDHKLLISSKSRYLYADESAFEIVDKIFPDRKDRGAYGSILLGECNKSKDSPPPLSGKLNVLIVDDETGDNGGVIDDGDCVGFTLTENFPNLTAEAIERNQPENAYLPTIKEGKKSFYIDETTEQPEFEAIALQMSDGISVGVINNHLTALEALESEIEIIRNSGDRQLIGDYIETLTSNYSKVLEKDDKQDNPSKKIPPLHRDYMERITELADAANGPEVVDRIFDTNKDFYRRLNEEASYQNQIAVDLFKSNRVPDTDAIKRNSSYLHRNVNYIRDKKQPGIYETKVVETTGYSPTEINIRRVNRHFAKQKLESRPISQFQNLFKGIEFSYQQKAEATLAKRNFDKYFNEAAELQKRQKIDEGQSVSVRTRSGLNFEITNTVRTGNFSKLKEVLEQDKAFRIEVKESKNKTKPHKYEVYAQFNNEKDALGRPKYQKIGTVMRDDEYMFKDMDSLPKNLDTKINEFKAAISDAQIKVRFDKALESADAFRSSIPDPQLKQYAAASWAVSTKRDTSDTELGFNKSASFAFNAFTNEIIDKIETLRFDEFTISNLKEAELQSDSIDFSTPQEIRFAAAAIEKDGNTEIKSVIQLKTPDGEYKEIGDISPTDGRLPLGTTASATINSGNLSTATLTIDNVSVKVNELNKYDTKINSGEEVEVLIQEGASYSDGETKIFIGDDYLGKLRPESHEEAVKNNWLKNNQTLQIKLDSIIGEGKHPYAIATTSEGNKLYVNIEDQYKVIDGEMQAIPNKFKGYSFDAEQVLVKPIVEKTGQKAIAYVNDKPIGTISQEDFKKIEPTGASLIPKSAKIEGNVTTLKVSLDKETIQYPEVWVKEREEVTGKESIAINTSSESYKVDEISSKLYQKITTRQAIAFEDTVDKYTNTFNLAVDERQLEATEKYLNKNNVEFQVAEKEDRPLEASKGMWVIAIDKESLDEKLLETILSRTGGIKSDKIEILEIPILKDESVFYSDPNANYGGNEYPAIGLAVPAPDSHLVNQFLDKYNLEVSGFNDNNVYYFSIIDVENFSYEQYNELYPAPEEQFAEYKQNLTQLKEDLNSHLGNPLDLSNENSFDNFEKKIAAIQEKLNNGYSTLERNRNIGTEYQQALQKLPERPNTEGYIEPPAPDISIVKKRREARAVLRIGSAYNPQTQESGASAILVSNDGKNQITQATNYYPSEKSDLKAAYQTLIQGLTEAQDRGYKALRIETSNNNLYQRLKGNPQYMHFNGKNKECEPLHKQVMKLAKSFEWGITPKFTSYKKYPTAEQANQVANNAIAQRSSVNDFGRSEPQQISTPIPQQVSTPTNQNITAQKITSPSQTVNNSQSSPPKQQTASKKRAGLTEGQKEALSKMMEFSKQPRTDKDNNEFLLEGYAGTGKTFVIQQFLKEVRKSGENPKIAFTAPTNNAVKVLREMADKQGLRGFEAKTTHKLLGLKRTVDKMSGDVSFARAKNSFERPELNYDYIVVDEASMLNKSLYEYCKEASQAGVKIIYMGDPAQLPPVNESESMVFSQVKNRSELTEVVRYDGDMARIAEDIRNNLSSKNPTPIQNSQDGTVVALSKEGFNDTVKRLFTSNQFKEDNSSVKVIAYTNNKVDQINQLVKDTLYGENAPEYLSGMRVIARDPVKGEFGIVLDTSEEMTITKAQKSKDGNLDIWMLEGITESGEYAQFNALDSESKPLFQKELSNLRKEIYNEPVEQRDWSFYYDLAERYGNVRPAYAITTHNSQGKTIPQGIVDQENINMRLSMALKEEDAEERARGIKEYNQLRYVAMTRFQNAVYVGTGQREQEINRSQTRSSPNIDTQHSQEWARYAPKGKEGYELSSPGDKRFSALNAKLQDGRTIEEAYQLDVKGYRSQGNDWRLGKGKAPLIPMTKEESYQQYKNLWKQWANENPQLINELTQKAKDKILTDKFASTDISQARALAEILNERNTESTLQNSQPPTTISLPSSKEADKNKSLEIIGQISENKVDQLRQHLEENYKPLVDADKSNYAPGRQVAWVEAKWDLKNKDFSPAVKDDKLMELVKQVYPDADIALVTYSEQAGQGIDYHRDDSYAAAEARSINIGDSMWGYQASKQGMVAWDPKANENASVQEFKLESGTVTRFNSKNPHAALETSAGRWSVNIWSIKNDLGKSNSVREKFDKFQASNQPPAAVVKTNNDLTIKNSEWTPSGEIKVERNYKNLQEANTAGIIRTGNATQVRAATSLIPDNPQISGKPIPMTWELNQPPELNVSTTIDAMRGNGRVHSTRAQDYYQTYGIKEGDIAIAKGKDNKQVAFRVGKQYKITQAMIDNPDYQKAWQNWEKHSVKELTQNQAAKGKERQLYGLFMEPLGDYENGKIIPFEQSQQQERTLNITFDGASRNNGKPNAQASAAAVLTNPEGRVKEFSQYLGNKTNNEAEFQAAIIGLKAAKELGYKSVNIQGDSQLVIESLQGKRNIKAANLKPLYEEAKSLVQSFDKIEINYIPREQNKAADALANKTLNNAAQQVNPISNLKPVTEATAKHMVKDKAMAEVATQYIGISAAPPNTPSSTRNYAEAWGDKANSGSYTNKDVIMVSGSGPWRGVTQNQIEETFQKQYIPLLDKAIEAKSSIVVGNAKGTDELVKNYLQENGYKLEQTPDNYARLSSQTKEVEVSTISKITSIGQFGADLGALEAAKDRSIKTEGVAANGYFTEKGQAPDLLQSYGLKEGEKGKGFGQTYKNAYSANIRSTDATVLVGRILNRKEDTDKDLIEIINRYDKPYLVIPKEEVLSDPQAVGEKISQFATQNNAQNLNIIGERESHAPGIQNAVREAIGKALELNSHIDSNVENLPQQNDSETKTKQVQVTQQNQQPTKKSQSNSQSKQNIGTTISAYSKDGLGAALSSETKLASSLGNLQNNYPVSYQDNKELPAGNYGGENYPEVKPKGQPFVSANQAYYAYQQPSEQAAQKIARMTEILKAKLEQHPRLVESITKRGGVKFLENSTHISSSQDKFWDGFGKESRFIQALSTAYTATIEKEQSKVSSENTDPVAQSLQQWKEDAQFLNRNYVETINQIQNIYANTKKPLTENHLKTMNNDSKDAAITKEVKNLVTRLTNTLVQDTREDGSKSVQGKKYILESNENIGFTRIVDTDNADILLNIENNQVKAQNISHDVYQSLKSAVQAVDEKIKSAQEITGYNSNKSGNNIADKYQFTQ